MGFENGALAAADGLAISLLADLAADYRLNGVNAIADLRWERPLSYLRLISRLLRMEGDGKPPRAFKYAAGVPPTGASADVGRAIANADAEQERHEPAEPYRVLKRSIAMEQLRFTIEEAQRELARLQAEEEEDARIAEEALDARRSTATTKIESTP